MKNIRNCLEHIPESISEFINRSYLLITNEEFIDSIINSDIWMNHLFGRNYNSITIINKIFDVKFISEYCTIYDELCKIAVENNSYNIQYIKPKYCTIYDELCRIAVEHSSYNIQYVNPEYCTIYNELCKISINNDLCNIFYINPKYCTIYNELKKGIS